MGHLTPHALRFSRYAIILIFTLSLLLFIWLLFSPRDDGSLAQIRRRGTLRVGLDASFPPFETIDANGQIVGLDVDIAQAIATDLGVEAEFINIGFDGLYDALLARRVDLIISGLPYDPHWTQDVAYTTSYFNAGQVLVTRTDEQSINTIEDLVGQTVAVEWGSQAEMEGRRLAKELDKKTSEVLDASEVAASLILLRQDTAAAALDSLLNNQASAAIVDAPSALSHLPRGLKIVTYLTDDWYTAAVHIESRELLETVNQSLQRLQESGDMAEMQTRWFYGRD